MENVTLTPPPVRDHKETALAAIETAMIATCKIVGDDFKSNSNVVRALGCLVDAGEFLEGTHEDSK